MEGIIGFVLGIAAVFLLKEYPACRPRAKKREDAEQQKRRRDYENFLRYDGGEQEDL